jgi:protein-S-isoprenylcysteine O-methyltransferase Ste14
VRASQFEFRYRFWIIFGLFWAGFGAYSIQHANLAMLLLHAISPGSETRDSAQRAIFGFAATLGILAAALRTWASAYLRSDIVHDTALRTEGLVADGPFRYVRNPLYLGNVLLSLGMALLMSPLGAGIVVLGQTFFLVRLIRREEWELLHSEGDRFSAYRAAVPMLVPSLAPCLPAGRVEPHVVEGFVGESFSWILALSLVAFALTLNSRIIPYFVGVGFVVYWLLFVVWKKRGRPAASPEKRAG